LTGLRKNIYEWVPRKYYTFLGKSVFLRPLRNLFFRKNGRYIESRSQVARDYEDYKVTFAFFASIQVASKAARRGMENTLLKNSIKLIKRYKRKDAKCIVIDIGTNFGYLSLVWANTIANRGKVYSFEPHPDMFKSFSKSIEVNQLQQIINAQNIALGETTGTIELNLAHTSANVLELSSIREKNNKLQAPVASLDDFSEDFNIENCDLIKIDVDGIELSILKGAQDFIKRFKPILIVETNNDSNIIDLVENMGYTTLTQDLKPYLKGNPLPLNAFFVPN